MLSPDYIRAYVSDFYSSDIADRVVNMSSCIVSDGDIDNAAKLCNNTERFDDEQIRTILHYIRDGRISYNTAMRYMSSDYNIYQMRVILAGLHIGLAELVDIYADSRFNADQMTEIYNGLANKTYVNTVKMYATPELSSDQMREIRHAIDSNVDIEIIRMYSKPGVSWEKMRMIFNGLSKGLSFMAVKLYANESLSIEQSRCIYVALLDDNLSYDKVTVMSYSYLDVGQMNEIRKGFLHGLTSEQVEMYANEKFNSSQMYEIRCGLEYGLSTDDVKIYSNKLFSQECMAEIRYGMQTDKLSRDKILEYAKPELDHLQMRELRRGFSIGLTVKQAREILDRGIDSKAMHNAISDMVS